MQINWEICRACSTKLPWSGKLKIDVARLTDRLTQVSERQDMSLVKYIFRELFHGYSRGFK
jgi:hypothetical protein